MIAPYDEVNEKGKELCGTKRKRVRLERNRICWVARAQGNSDIIGIIM